jgi:hypothetical protein
VDVLTVAASAGLSALVAVFTATRVASRGERGREIFTARTELRMLADAPYNVARQVELDMARPPRLADPGVHGDDYVFAAQLLAIARRLPNWRRVLVRRRCVGPALTDLADVHPPTGTSPGELIAPMLSWQARRAKDGEPLKPMDLHGLFDAFIEGSTNRQRRQLRRALGRLRQGW